MSMLITSLEEIRRQTTPEGFRLFCEEEGMDPENPEDREEGFMIDKLDLLRYGMEEAYTDLRASTYELTGGLVGGKD